MATVTPFTAIRPDPRLAARVCELPYDVMTLDEARAMAAGNPLSFLRVSRPEIAAREDAGTDAAYARAAANFRQLIDDGVLRRDARPMFHLYRQVVNGHGQTGLVALANCDEYRRGVVRKHERTRPDKVEDRTRHIEALDAQTGPVFLTYKAVKAIDTLVFRITAGEPEVDFEAPDGVRHSSWPVADAEDIAFLVDEFAKLPALYIADGHNRSAAAARVLEGGGDGGTGFLTLIVPHNQVNILAYNRVLRDLNGRSEDELLRELGRLFEIREGGPAMPVAKHQFGLYLGGKWHALDFRPAFVTGKPPVDLLDVSLLQTEVLGPLFGLTDPLSNDRISFVGGIRGPACLEKLVDSGGFACAFTLFPTGIDDLMEIADADGILPPRSTSFEPKPRDGMFCHLH